MIRRFPTLAFLLLFSLNSGFGNAEEVAIAVRGTPVVDGVAEEMWNQAPEIPIDQLVTEALLIPTDQAARGTARIMWDDDRIYVLFDVHDKKVVGSHPDAWEQDSVEMFVDENNGKRGVYEKDDFHCRCTYRGLRSGGTNFDLTNVKSAAKKTDDGYRAEMSARWRTLRPKANQKIGLELQINDDAGGGRRQSIAKWRTPNNSSWQNTSQFGDLILKEQATKEELEAAKARLQKKPQPATDATSQLQVEPTEGEPVYPVPDWVRDAVFYQIFPERFRNGDPANDPIRESLEIPSLVPTSWRLSEWTSDWYDRAEWEVEAGNDFYENGVFNRRYGGDLQGVIDKLDYLADLGINTIYFNPVFYARSLHKYDGNSFHHIDPYFGPRPAEDLRMMAEETSDPATWHWTAADRLFLDLVAKAKQRNIRVIIDGVFNHCGRDFFAFADLREKQQQSNYTTWFNVESYDDPSTPENEFKYECWWGVESLPNFADSADGSDLFDGPKEYIFNATRRWMDPNGDGQPNDGIAGWRLDVANEVPNRFWVDWHALVKSLNPDAYTVAEIWTDARTYLQDTGFTATMNYHGFAFPTKGFLIDGRMKPSAFVNEMENRRDQYPLATRYALQNLIDSHDTDRVASMIVNASGQDYLQPGRFDYDVSERCSARANEDYDVAKPNDEQRRIQKLVALLQVTYVGPPMIYYGTEAGMWGGDDPDDRKPMIWADKSYDDESHHPRGKSRPADTVSFDSDLHAFYRDAIALRTKHASLRRGQFSVIIADDDKNCLAFVRSLEDQAILVLINRDQQSQRLTIAADDLPASPRFLLSTDTEPVTLEKNPLENQWTFELAPLTGTAFAVGR